MSDDNEKKKYGKLMRNVVVKELCPECKESRLVKRLVLAEDFFINAEISIDNWPWRESMTYCPRCHFRR